MTTILDKIFADKQQELDEARRKVPLSQLKDMIQESAAPLDFSNALHRKAGEGTRIIAEIKPKSPFKGPLRDNVDPSQIGKIYADNGASAISVLTESTHFGGCLENLRLVRAQAENIPLLRKDFLSAEYQVYEARAFGADAFLLIADALEAGQIEDLLCLGVELGMSGLVESHDEHDLEKAFMAGATLIGINNRDLKTGKTELGIARQLIPMASFDEKNILVCESGIRGREEIEKFEKLGAHAFLIGESLMTAEDIPEKLRSLLGDGNDATADAG